MCIVGAFMLISRNELFSIICFGAGKSSHSLQLDEQIIIVGLISLTLFLVLASATLQN
jgi:hypothetical protein